MKDSLRNTPETARKIDITTTGRRSGRPRRIEVRLYNLDGLLYLTGTPGIRDWYANLLANPVLTIHLKEGVLADLPASATPIRDPDRRSEVLSLIHELGRGRLGQLDAMVDGSPLVEVHLDS